MSFDATKVKFDESDVKRESANTVLAEGWYKFAVDSNVIKEDEKTKNIVSVMKCSPLDADDGETPRRPQQWNRLTLPLCNPEYSDEFDDEGNLVKAGHMPPDWAKGITWPFLHALSPDDVPLPPKKVDGGWQYQGEDIDPSEVEEKKAEAVQALGDVCVRLVQDPNLFKGYHFFGRIRYKDGYVNIINPCAELPDDATLVPNSEFLQRVEGPKVGGEEADEEKPAAKANGKPVAKANGKAAPAKGKKKS